METIVAVVVKLLVLCLLVAWNLPPLEELVGPPIPVVKIEVE